MRVTALNQARCGKLGLDAPPDPRPFLHGGKMPTLPDDLRQLIEYDQLSARPLLHDLAERLPRSAEARALLGQSYLRSFEVAPALEHYKIAHDLDPKNLHYRQQLGLCAVAMGDYQGAYNYYQEAKQLAPTEHSEALSALMLHRLGRFQESFQSTLRCWRNSSAITWKRRTRFAAWRCCFATPALPSPLIAISTSSSPSSASTRLAWRAWCWSATPRSTSTAGLGLRTSPSSRGR